MINHVLIPHPANWASPPTFKRTWQSEIVSGLPGNETRSALRAVPRRQITFTITTRTLAERARLDARIEAATKSGLACAPLHGRACVLAAATVNTLTLASPLAWNWQAGDYAILLEDDQTCDVAKISAVNQNTLDLETPLQLNWFTGHLVYPLIFGKFSAEKQSALDGALAEQTLTVAELVSSRAVAIGSLPMIPPGIGAALLGSTFIVQ